MLNIIASKLKAASKNELAHGKYFDMYVENCNYEKNNEEQEVKIITSDDIFDYLIDIEYINSNCHRRKEELAQEYLNYKYNNTSDFINDYQQLKNKVKANSKTMSSYIREHLNNNIIPQSNGETALFYWENEIKENGIYILDEPENSLSSENQLKLKQFIEDSVRFYNCQFIISSHSLFLLNLKDALIYDLDEIPVKTKKWSELKNVRLYYDFIKENWNKF